MAVKYGTGDRCSHLIGRMLASAREFADRPCLEIGNCSWSYKELASFGAGISDIINAVSPSRLAAVIGERSFVTYAGIWGILASGRGYVPLSPAFPANRIVSIIEQSGVDVVIVSREAGAAIAETLSALPRLTLVFPDTPQDEARSLKGASAHTIIGAEEVHPCREIQPSPSVRADDLAYLIFTSGTTGQPKGVPVRNSSVTAYVDYITARFLVTERDRFAQKADLTFDFSIHELFGCWCAGATLCVIPKEQIFAPARFIKEKRISMWSSVPSTAVILHKMRLLKPGVFPSLRWSVFCGEPLTPEIAKAWAEACPNGTVENIYGPTEATVAITHYRWDPKRSPNECTNGVVPLGWVFEGQSAAVVGPDRMALAPGEVGELALRGSQVTDGYWGSAAAMNSKKFGTVGGRPDGHWYFTGDLARYDERGCFYFHGRADQQVKVRGYRVELQEVEHALREVSGADLAVAIAWPLNSGSADGIVGFVSGTRLRAPEIRNACRGCLPEYMVPSDVHVLDTFPLSGNGKVDRNQLVSLYLATDQ